jgi:hypothetical protein
MSDMLDFEELSSLVKLMKAKHLLTPKRYKMSHATLHEIERRFDLVPWKSPSSTLWGIVIEFDEDVPLNEVQPVY